MPEPAPALTGLGTTGFATESVDGKTWKVQTFDDNSGVQLSPTANEMAPGAYTIVVLFESRHRRIRAPHRLQERHGRHRSVQPGGYLSFYNLAAGAAATIGSTFVQVVLTRGADGTVSGYVDGAQQFTFTDTASQAVISNDTLRFFQDNTSGGAGFEASPGAVARIRLYDKALTASEVGSLNQPPRTPARPPEVSPSPASTLRSGRDAPFEQGAARWSD